MTKPVRGTLVGYLFLFILLFAAASFVPAIALAAESNGSTKNKKASPSPYGDDASFFLPSPGGVDVPPDHTAVAGTPSPILAAINVTQLGSDGLQLNLRGRMIPIPRQVSAPGEDKLVIQFDGIGFPQVTDKNDWMEGYEWDVLRVSPPGKNTWWKQYDLPLLDRINAEPYGGLGVRLTFTTSKPLVIDSVNGLAGSDNMTVILKAYRPPKPEPAPVTPPVYGKGDPLGIKSPVTLQLRDADLKSVFMMLADTQKLNLFLDPSVPDMTIPSIIFNGIPFNEAFSYLLRVAELSYSLTGSTLIVGKTESLGTLLDKNVTRGYTLGYAVDDSGQIRGDVTAALTGLVPLAKTPVVDGRNRTLYVTATEEQHREVAEVLQKLDAPGQQIMIQAKVVEVNVTAAQNLEQVISAVYDRWLMNFSSAGIRLGFNQSNRQFNTVDLSLPIGGAVSGTSPVVVPNTDINGAERTLMAGLNALESNNKLKILAHPSVIAIDGQPASVNASTEMTYRSGTDANGNPEIDTVSYGPSLTFTPTIGRDGWITIKLDVNASTPATGASSGSAYIPATANRQVTTVVRVHDGEPFAVGGLYQENKNSTRNRMPVLGYIPLLGDLFTTRIENHVKNEVAIIAIPYILDVSDDGIKTFDLQKHHLSTR